MPMSLIAIRRAARYLAGCALITLAAGCAGDDLLLPGDGAPAELRIVSGDQQRAPAGDPVELPLVVEALDADGRPAPGAVVVFQFVEPPSGAELEPANAETGPDGRASAEVTLGNAAGDQTVEARLDGAADDLKVQFQLTALQRGGGGGGRGGGGDDGNGGNGGGGDDGNGNGNGKGKGKGKDDG
jgi:uncharacterized membrane protein YgcG